MITIPPFTSWYIKIQILAYLIHFVSYKLKQEIKGTVLLLMIYTLVAAFMKVDDFWWTSPLCYGIGIVFAKYKEKAQRMLSKRAVIVISIMFFAMYFISWRFHRCTLFMCITGVVFLAGLSMHIEERRSIMSRIVKKLGSCSYELYLTQAVMIYLLLSDDLPTLEIRLLLYMLLSILGSIVVNKVMLQFIKVSTNRSIKGLAS